MHVLYTNNNNHTLQILKQNISDRNINQLTNETFALEANDFTTPTFLTSLENNSFDNSVSNFILLSSIARNDNYSYFLFLIDMEY